MGWETYAVWGAIILGGGSAVAWIKFWMDQGEIKNKAATAAETAANLAARLELHINRYQDDRMEFVSRGELTGAESRLTATVEGIRVDIRLLREAMDRYFGGNRASS